MTASTPTLGLVACSMDACMWRSDWDFTPAKLVNWEIGTDRGRSDSFTRLNHADINALPDQRSVDVADRRRPG